MSLFLNVFAATVLGALVLELFDIRFKIGELLGLSFGIGSGVITLTAFLVMAAFGAEFSMLTMTISIVALCVVFVLLATWRTMRHGDRPFLRLPEMPRKPSIVELGLVAAIALLVCYTFVIAAYWPPWMWDALAIYVVKSNAIFESRLLSGHLEGAWNFYPLHVPLQVALLRLPFGERPIQTVFPFYMLGLLLVVKDGLLRLAPVRRPLFFVLLLAATPILLTHASAALADLPTTFYYISSVLCLLAFFYGGQSAFAILSGLLVGMTSWTRPDGMMSFGINYLVLLIYLSRERSRPRWAMALAYPLAFSIFWMPWAVYTRANGYGNSLFSSVLSTFADLVALRFSWDKALAVLQYFLSQWFALDVWGSVWLVFGLSLINWSKVREHIFLIMTIGLNIAGLLFTYYATPDAPPLKWWLEGGFSRMAFHFMPLLWVYTCLVWDAKLSHALEWFFGQIRMWSSRMFARE